MTTQEATPHDIALVAALRLVARRRQQAASDHLALPDGRILKWTRYIAQKPLFPDGRPTKQADLLAWSGMEALYGGAAGGGKSSALLMAALQYVDMPGYAALVLRKSYADLSLPGALMDRAFEWLSGTDARWNSLSKTWSFPSGAALTFGYLDNPQDKFRYQSSEFQYIGFDELTQFPESEYRYLFSRLRRHVGVEAPLRMHSCSNPGGLGHEWVKQRFIVEGPANGRGYFPARLGDNPYLDTQEYTRSLMELDPVTRQQLLEGDWSARQGGSFFKREWFEIVDETPRECAWVRYWDMAAAEAKPGKDPDWTVGAKIGRTAAGLYYVADIQRLRASPSQVDARIVQTAEMDGLAVAIWMEREPGASGLRLIDYYRRKVLAGYNFRGDSPISSKTVRASPVSSQAEAGNMKLVRGPWIGAFLDEIEGFPNGEHDDQVDALSGAMSKVYAGIGMSESIDTIGAPKPEDRDVLRLDLNNPLYIDQDEEEQ